MELDDWTFSFGGDQSFIEIAAAMAAPKDVVSAIAGRMTSIPEMIRYLKLFKVFFNAQCNSIEWKVTVEVGLYLH